MATKADPGDTNFTVFIRLPFPRNNFVDPPPVEWNAAKDQALWDILSRPSRGDGIDWKSLADSFDVTLQFLLQQAAWLYDRQFSHVRAQMRKYDPTAQSNSPSPAPGSISGSIALGGPAAKGGGTGGLRAPLRQGSQQKDIPQRGLILSLYPISPDSDLGTVSGHARRTSSASTTTINQFRVSGEPSRTDTPTAEGTEQPRDSISNRPPANKREQPPIASFLRSPSLEEEDILSSSSDSEEDLQPAAHRFRRFGQFSMHRASLRDDENDEEDDTPAFLPTSHDLERAARDRASPVMGSTLRINADRAPVQRRRIPDRTVTTVPLGSESSTSSMSSGVPVAVHGEIRRSAHGSGTLGPQRVGEPTRLSPHKSNASGREASDGTPSMGSSFSDLDDTSVTQSAMEEALMSNMQHGGMASRMSTISQALRSRYLQ
ncbi:uncharacterized protein N7483_012975 [Penicillium malachiteum]|uniref:uncharacterized protein n=1 Tax=Penicillium malachiteum TaxID=1324776 RepID=UPI0025473EA3|nr:uncharacterized protein N7483_012975 [Penicillium malachiteum]KAJ5715794.1 hypothetical protein N7483_012975 [Penicillium malachiteum]